MYPPDSGQPYPPPPGGQYPQPPVYQPYQPYPGYPYPPQPPPRPGMSTGKIIAIIVVAVVLVIVVPVVLAGVLVVYLQTLPQGAGDVETALGLRTERTMSGDWVISVTSGSASASAVTLQVFDPTSGAEVFHDQVNAMNSANCIFNDNNANSKLDAGDTILIKDTSSVDPGMKVQFTKGEFVIGMVKELPS